MVAAGGTGAKVVESLVHLCAAGLGPMRADVLLLDVDQANGNVARTQETIELYQKLSQWDWTISPREANTGEAIRDAQVRFFATEIKLHLCLEPIEIVSTGGLEAHLDPHGGRTLLDLLYTQSEQESVCAKGFLARPNLGSLVLGGHLARMLKAESGGAVEFKRSFSDALNGATPNSRVPLIIAGSIFGGTGASLFPVACACLQEAVNPTSNSQMWKDKVSTAAVMLAPYFLPRASAADDVNSEAETVDPSRFTADTANTLDHYTDTNGLSSFNAAYLIGSDDPGQNQLRFVEGARDQSNPPFIEELVAALAVFDAAQNPARAVDSRRLFEPPAAACLEWRHLPFPQDGSFRLALLLELAAFTLLPARAGQPLSGGLLDGCQRWSDQFELLPWYERLLGNWARANFSEGYGTSDTRGSGWKTLSNEKTLPGEAAASRARQPIAEYFLRCVLWARSALPSSGPYGLVKLGEEMDYAVVWELICGVTEREIEPATHGTGVKDNALVRLERAAAVALAKIAVGRTPARGVVNSVANALPGFPGRHEGPPKPLSLPIAYHAIEELAHSAGVRSDVHEKFTKTQIS